MSSNALAPATEELGCTMFVKAGLLAGHANRETVQPNDMKLLQELDYCVPGRAWQAEACLVMSFSLGAHAELQSCWGHQWEDAVFSVFSVSSGLPQKFLGSQITKEERPQMLFWPPSKWFLRY